MEELLYFFLRVCLGSSLLYVFYFSFLRKTTFFQINRIYLISATILPVLLSLFPLHYTVVVQADTTQDLVVWSNILGQTPMETELSEVSSTPKFNWVVILFAIYITGVLLFSLRLLIQSLKPIQIIFKNKRKPEGRYQIHENRHFSLPFSFFNHIFIHPDYHKQEDLESIIAHEEVHIRELHWIDLLVIEVFTLVFWFNPFSWLLEHAIKQNHEYLADSGVLSRGQSPVRYQLLLVNQLMGMQVLGFTNNLNFALGPTRLKMMKKQKTPKKKLIRFALIIPVLAVLLVAFAQPEYHKNEINDLERHESLPVTDTTDKIKIMGTVVDTEGTPLWGTTIVVKGTTIGTVVDKNGHFELEIPVGGDFALVASFVGYKTNVNELNLAENRSNSYEVAVDGKKYYTCKNEYNFVMEKSVIVIDTDFPEQVPPPPPAFSDKQISGSDDVFFVVEDLPHYPMGHYGLGQYIKTKKGEVKEKIFLEGKKLTGKATMGFTVNSNGEVTNIQVLDKTTEEAGKAATAIVAGMDKWSPGKQRGKAVPVNYAIELEF